MSELIQASREHITYYWLAYCYGFLFSLNALVTAIIASFLNTDWGTLTGTKKFILICVIISNWTGTMIAFLNKTMSRLRDGLPPIQPEPNQSMNIKPVAVLTIGVCLSLSAQAQSITNPPAPPVPASITSTVVGYFTSFDQSMTTFRDNRFDLWTGATSIQGADVPLVNDIGLSYDIWRPTPAANSTVITALDLENTVRNSGVAGTIVGEQAGLGFSVIVWDTKLTIYANAGYDLYGTGGKALDRLYGEIGLRAKKAIGQHFYLGVGLGAQVPRNAQVFSGFAGATF